MVKSDFKYHGYLDKDDIWLSFLLDEIDKKTLITTKNNKEVKTILQYDDKKYKIKS